MHRIFLFGTSKSRQRSRPGVLWPDRCWDAPGTCYHLAEIAKCQQTCKYLAKVSKKMQKRKKSYKSQKRKLARVSTPVFFALFFAFLLSFFLNFTIPKTRRHISIFCNNHNKKNTMWHCKIHITDSNICKIHIAYSIFLLVDMCFLW